MYSAQNKKSENPYAYNEWWEKTRPGYAAHPSAPTGADLAAKQSANEQTQSGILQSNTEQSAQVGTAIRPILENQYKISGDRIGYKDGQVTLDGKGHWTADYLKDGISYINDPNVIHNSFTKVRPILENQYNIAPNRLNYANGQVTLDGQGLFTPTTVADGVSYVTDPSVIHNALTQVRPAMHAYGIKDDRIGFENGQVTLDGKPFLMPDTIGSDNRSYVTGNKVADAFSAYGSANNVLPARSYIEGQNLGINVGWDANTGEVLVGSTRLRPDYISQDGRAQVSKERLDAAIAKEKDNTGIYSGWDIWDKVNSRYGDRIDRLYDRVNDRESFSYDINKDPVYQAFAKQWTEDVNRAYDDTVAKLNSQSGGAPSLGALAAAWNLRGQAQDQLANYQNQFREQAYQKWADEYARDVQNLETALALREDEFNRAYGINRDALNDKRYDSTWARDLITRGLTDEQIVQAIRGTEQAYRFAEEEQPYTINAYKHAEELYPYETQQAAANVEQTIAQTKVMLNEDQRAAAKLSIEQQLAAKDMEMSDAQIQLMLQEYEINGDRWVQEKYGISLDNAIKEAKLSGFSSRSGKGGSSGGDESSYYQVPADSTTDQETTLAPDWISQKWLPWYLQE